jgi:Immunity protein 26
MARSSQQAMNPRTRFGEGDWFALPLRDGGFGIGLIARANADGILVGYFFGRRRDKPPTIDELVSLQPSDAVLVCRFGHLGLRQGKWPIIGHAEPWDPRAWPMPRFVRHEALSGRSFYVLYDDHDPNRLVREERIAPGSTIDGPTAGLFGSGAVEKVMTSKLR